MIDYSLSFLAGPPDPEEEEEKRFYGVVTGFVTNIIDPWQLGRVQLIIPDIDDFDLSCWAPIAVPMSGILSGVAFLPQVKDKVLIAFEHGDICAPYVIGSLWHGFAVPPPNVPPDFPFRTSYVIKTPSGNTLLMVEPESGLPQTIVLAAPLAGASITMIGGAGTAIVSATTVSILVGGATITVTPAGIALAGSTISLVASGAINMAAPEINMIAEGDCKIIGNSVIIDPVPV
jgi:hypothetical protein